MAKSKNDTKSDGTLTKEAIEAAEAKAPAEETAPVDEPEVDELGRKLEEKPDEQLLPEFDPCFCTMIVPTGAPDVTMCILIDGHRRMKMGVSTEGEEDAKAHALSFPPMMIDDIGMVQKLADEDIDESDLEE